MENQITTNSNALKLFFTEDVFLVPDPSVIIAVKEPIIAEAKALAAETETIVKSYINSTMANNELQEQSILEEPAVSKEFKYLGGNKKSVLIIVHDKNFEVSTVEGRELLRKIVKAMELSTPDFALFNYANFEGTSFEELQQFFKPALMLSFGVAEKNLNLAVQWTGEIINHQNTRMIFAPNLHALDSDLNGKKSLWANLKKL